MFVGTSSLRKAYLGFGCVDWSVSIHGRLMLCRTELQMEREKAAGREPGIGFLSISRPMHILSLRILIVKLAFQGALEVYL